MGFTAILARTDTDKLDYYNLFVLNDTPPSQKKTEDFEVLGRKLTRQAYMNKKRNGTSDVPLFDLKQFEFSRSQHPDSVDLEGDPVNWSNSPTPKTHESLQSLIEKISYLENRILEIEKSSAIRLSQNSVTEPGSAESLSLSKVENSSVMAPSQNSVTELSIKIWLEEYPKKGHFYLKVVWVEKPKRRRHKHVRGGNVESSIIQKKREKIQVAIALKFPLSEIMKLCL